MRTVRVLVAVEPWGLLKVIEHLLGTAPEIRIVSRLRTTLRLTEHARRLQPDLVIANVRLLGGATCELLAAIRRFSPRSKCILTDVDAGLVWLARQCGADAFLEEETLVSRLLPTARRLAARRSRRKLPGRRINPPGGRRLR